MFRRLTLFLALAVLSLSIGMTISAPMAKAAPVDTLLVQQQATLWQSYVALTTDSVCGDRWGGPLTTEQVVNIDWFQGGFARTEIRLGTLLDNRGAVQYGDGSQSSTVCSDSWLTSALDAWGYKNNYSQFLRDIGFQQSGDTWKNTGVSASKVAKAIQNKYYGGKPPALTDAMRYSILTYNYSTACGGKIDSPPVNYSTATGDVKTAADGGASTDHFWTVIRDGDTGKLQDTIWQTTKLTRTDKVVVGYRALDGMPKLGGGSFSGSDYEASCGQIAFILRNNKGLADAFLAASKTNPANLGSIDAVNQGSSNAAGDNCPLAPDASARWIGCAIFFGLKDAADKLTNTINTFLYTPTDIFNEPAATAAANTFRNLGIVLVVIAGLVMIIAQASGSELVDAYTIRKLLPRMAVAIIGMALSWPLLKLAVTLTNDLGAMIYAVFIQISTSVGAGGAPVGGGSSLTAVLGGVLVGGVALGVLGAMGFISLIVTVILALLVGLLVLSVRQLVIFMAVILAPLAIAAYVLPGTQKLWGFWKNTFITTLIMYPLIMGFIGAGQAMSYLLGATKQAGDANMSLLAIIVYFAPFFMLPFAFKMAGGLMSTIFSMANDRNRGMFDRLKKYRAGKTEESMARVKQGFDRSSLGTRFRASNERRLAGLSAMGSGAVGVGGVGTGRYRNELHQSELAHLAAVSAEAIKNNPSAAQNDDANKIAQYATSKSDFIDRYSRMRVSQGATREAAREEAQRQLTYTEQSFGSAMGSKEMQSTTATSVLAASASTDSNAERAQWMRHAVSSGLMTDAQAASLVKQSGTLTSSAGFGDLLAAANGTMSDDDLLEKASQGFNPANSQRMRKGQAQELAKHMLRKADEAATIHGTGSDEFAKTIADAAGLHDVMNGMTPDVREEFAKHLNGDVVAGRYVREHEAQMEAAGNGAYLDRRKTWNSSAVAAGGGMPGGPVGGPAGGGAPGGPAGGGAPGGPAGGGAPPSDRRLKRDISVIGQYDDITLYRFRYLWDDQEYVGVMAQDLIETHPEALIVDELGFYRVDYARLGLHMMTFEEYEATTIRA